MCDDQGKLQLHEKPHEIVDVNFFLIWFNKKLDFPTGFIKKCGTIFRKDFHTTPWMT
jgi:hypothetical protein